MAERAGHAPVGPQPVPTHALLRTQREDRGRDRQEPVQVEWAAAIGAHSGECPLVVQGHRVAQAAGQELGPGEADRPHPVLRPGHGQQEVLLQTREVQGPGDHAPTGCRHLKLRDPLRRPAHRQPVVEPVHRLRGGLPDPLR
jgi:hypothetical protein